MDRHAFFGRDFEVEEVVDLWVGRRFVVLHGMPGVGKTSLLQAGVLPRLRKEQIGPVLPLGKVSVVAGSGDGNPFLRALAAAWFPNVDHPDESALLSTFRAVYPAAGTPIFAAIDQFEDFFVVGARSRGHRERFLGVLAELLYYLPGLRLLLSIQKDFMADMLAVEADLNAVPRSRFRLLPLEPEEAEQAVRGPWTRLTSDRPDDFDIRAAVQEVQAASAPTLAGEIENVDNFPVDPLTLQLVCQAMWPAGAVVKPARGGPEAPIGCDGIGLVVDYCARAVKAVSSTVGLAAADIWEWLAGTFLTEIGTRRVVPVAELRRADEDLAWLAEVFVNEGLLALVDCAGIECYQLLHSRLIEPIRFSGRRGQIASNTVIDLLEAATVAYENNDFSLAQKRAIEAMAIDREDYEVRARCEVMLGRIAVRQGRLEFGEALLRSAALLFASVNDQQAVGRVQARLGRVLMELDRVDEAAVEFYSAAVKVTDDEALALDLARAFRRSGDSRAAIAVLASAPGGNTDLLAAGIEYAWNHLVLGDATGALGYLEGLADIDPSVEQWEEIEQLREKIAEALHLGAA